MAFEIFLVLFLVLNAFRTFDAAAVEHDSDPDTRWESFKKTYQKAYSVEEEEMRRKNFEENYRKISEHNQRYDQGMHSFYLGINEYSDMLIKEIRSTMNGLIPRETNTTIPTPFTLPDCAVPDAVDWRNESAVTPVKNQGPCGSCYSFSATGALEGQHKLKRGKLVSLSEQNIIDCSFPEGNHGCRGGYPDSAFEYVIRNGGIDSEESYPYRAKVGYCDYKPSKSASQCSGFYNLPSGNETLLQIACACIGPISVGIDDSYDSFQNYKGGIYDEPKCRKDGFYHAVLLVGYGSEDGQDYWLLKNSYGTSWGIDGYMKMARNKNNMCGIASFASYPVLKED